MQAIIQDRGRQYLVDGGDTLVVDHLNGVEAGAEHVFEQVLVLGDKIGTPYVKGAKVVSKVEGHVSGPKLYVQKFKRRKDYRRRRGHRQSFTRITIQTIG